MMARKRVPGPNVSSLELHGRQGAIYSPTHTHTQHTTRVGSRLEALNRGEYIRVAFFIGGERLKKHRNVNLTPLTI